MLQAQQNKQLFQYSWHFGNGKQYSEAGLERSFGKTAVFLGIGGSDRMGSDMQYVAPSEANSVKKRADVVSSKTIDKFPTVYKPESYLERSETRYRGAFVRIGVSHYFQAKRSELRLSGLYTGLDLIAMQTFEHQTLTYRIDKDSPETWSGSDENQFFTLGVAIKTGYVWYPMRQQKCCIRFDISHPFYIPFAKEINVNSPFAGSSFEGAVAIGFRIGSR